VVKELERLVDPATQGDPMSPLRWTSKSTGKLAEELCQRGFAISARSVLQEDKRIDGRDRAADVGRASVLQLAAHVGLVAEIAKVLHGVNDGGLGTL
jgi:hypothetical protein